MEFYIKTVPVAKFAIPTPDTTVTAVSYSLNGSTPVSVAPSNPPYTDGIVTAQLPYLQSEGDLEIMWSFTVPGSGSFTDNQYHTVVTPILSTMEIKEIHPNSTSEEVAMIEKAVRNIINSHCGQTFGYYLGKKTVYGSGTRTLRLPAHLLEFYDENGVTAPFQEAVREDGWALLKTWPDAIEYYDDNGVLHFEEFGVIFDPYSSYQATRVWQKGYPFTINGAWGYYSVPAPVVEAAKLLVNDYACGDAQYRDRFLTSMTAADWRIQFHAGAFTNTGNVRANQLLENYVVKNEWVAI